jgi:hypothetical protein
VIVEYAGILAAISLLAVTLTGAYSQNVSAVFVSSSVAIASVGKAAKAQKISSADAKAAYKRSPYRKTALKYLYALGWIGGTKNPGQCGLTLLGEGAARDVATLQIRGHAKLMAQLSKRGVSATSAANALAKGVVSACA